MKNTKTKYYAARNTMNKSGANRPAFASPPVYDFWHDQLRTNPRVTGTAMLDADRRPGRYIRRPAAMCLQNKPS